ncbi:MAG TPA: PilZ domain-containing protein [Terriglobales bacterium]|nr:PilZ domain-containing protein [Terriglobales bacterium]
MPSPQQPLRRYVRYPLHLPVSVRLDDQEIRTQSENISIRGILLSCASPIPEGSAVELAITVGSLPNPAVFLFARGTVLRVQRKPSGDFAVAIECDRPFGLTRQNSNPDPTQIQ